MRVEEVLGHRQLRNHLKFKVRWEDGDIAEQKSDSFVDVEADGKKRWTQKIKEYAKKVEEASAE